MIVMDSKDLLTEVSMFLKVTLVGENLSDHAEGCRQKLIAKLTNRDASPPPTQAYVDMNGSSHCHHKVQQQHSNCYEEFDRTFYSNTKDKPHIPDAFMNNLYNNTNSMGEENIYANNDETENYINIKYTSQNQEDNLYINPTSPLANTPVTPSKPSLVLNSTSNSNSERNSVISFKKDSPDRISVSSSLTSNSRCEESPEVLAVSASAMRYKATKTGLLRRREKIFFMDHRKPYWVALINETLFMFTSDKDAKPLFELDISGYKARAVVISASTKPDYKFELIAPGSKTHQFCADNELNMKSWISAINIATKQSDPDPIREWGRQLPSLPAVQNMYDQPGPRRMTCPVTYDQPDSTKQPLIETEYESPDGVASCVSQSSPVRLALNHELSQFLTKGKKSTDQLATPPKQNGERRSPSASGRQSASPRETRRLPLLPHQQLETYDKLEPTVRPVNDNPELYETLCEEVYHCIDDTQLQNLKEPRRLPLLPYEQETYDQPEPTVRPVNNLQNVQRESRKLPLLPPNRMLDPNSHIVQEGVYSDTVESDRPSSEEALYNNVTEEDSDTEFDDIDDDGDDQPNYCNTLPYPEQETDRDCIYDVITEQRQLLTASPVSEPLGAAFPPSSDIEQKVNTVDKKRVSSHYVNSMATFFSKSFMKPQLKEVKPPVINKSFR